MSMRWCAIRLRTCTLLLTKYYNTRYGWPRCHYGLPFPKLATLRESEVGHAILLCHGYRYIIYCRLNWLASFPHASAILRHARAWVWCSARIAAPWSWYSLLMPPHCLMDSSNAQISGECWPRYNSRRPAIFYAAYSHFRFTLATYSFFRFIGIMANAAAITNACLTPVLSSAEITEIIYRGGRRWRALIFIYLHLRHLAGSYR